MNTNITFAGEFCCTEGASLVVPEQEYPPVNLLRVTPPDIFYRTRQAARIRRIVGYIGFTSIHAALEQMDRRWLLLVDSEPLGRSPGEWEARVRIRRRGCAMATIRAQQASYIREHQRRVRGLLVGR